MAWRVRRDRKVVRVLRGHGALLVRKVLLVLSDLQDLQDRRVKLGP